MAYLRYEELLQLPDDELLDYFDDIELDPGLLRQEIRTMTDLEILDEYVWPDLHTPDDLRAMMLSLGDADLLRYHGATTPEILREEIEGWKCLDCDMWLDDEYYMVHDEIWFGVNPEGKGMLCIGCLETRLGRERAPEDFTDALINDISGAPNNSMRLNERMGHDVTLSVDYDADVQAKQGQTQRP